MSRAANRRVSDGAVRRWQLRPFDSSVVVLLAIVTLGAKLLWVGYLLGTPDQPPHHRELAATFALLALIMAVLHMMPDRARVSGALLANAVGTAIALADLWHMRMFLDVTSVGEIGQLRNVAFILPSIRELMRPADLLLLTDLPVLVACALQAARSDRPRRWRWGVASALVAAAVAAAVPVVRLITADPDEVFAYAFQRSTVVSAIGLGGYHVYDIAIQIVYPILGRTRVRDDDVSEVERAIRDRLEGQFASALTGIARGRSVVVLSVESLHAFALNASIRGEALTPHLNSFARESLHFTEFFDQTHMGTTADAELAALASLMPLSSGAAATRYATNDFRALPHVLSELGYQTLSATAEPPSFWNMRQMHPALGFRRSLFAPEFRGEWIGVGLSDMAFFEQMVPVLSGLRDPFFAFLLSSSSHHPYKLPAHLRTGGGVFEGTMAGDYLQSLRYFDRAFGMWVSELRRTGILERAAVVVFGDHQAWLEDEDLRRLWSTMHSVEPSVFDLWRFRRRVPLLIRMPGGAAAGERTVPGGQLDLSPTIASLLGIRAPVPWLGRDLTAPSARLVAFRDGSVTNGQAYRIVAGSTSRCYDHSGDALPCGALAMLVQEARRTIGASDRLIAGNLSGSIVGALSERPSPPRRPLVPPLVIAHRGYSLVYPENTLEAISAAFDAGADAVEIDVRLSRDGVPIVFHDDTLDRTTNGQGLPGALTFAELKRLDAGSWKARRFAGARIASLEEVIRAARGRGSLLFDLKVDGLARPIAEAYGRTGADPAGAWIIVWLDSQRAEFIAHMPAARLLWTEDAPAVWRVDRFQSMRARGLWGFELGDYWPATFVAEATRHDMPVIAYTVNDERTMRALIEIGVRGIETDDPPLLIRVARALGVR